MKVLGVIPARHGSTRFPGKPLALIHGRSMIERVYRQAVQCQLIDQLVVATDDQRIFDHVKSFGGQAIMTSTTHPNGTSRCLEVYEQMGSGFDLVVNIQGDEPYIHPDQISKLINSMQLSDASIGTLVKKIVDAKEIDNQNIVKVVRQFSDKALYFSRSPIPFCKPENQKRAMEQGLFLKHVGIYAYRSEILPDLPAMTAGVLEQAESLEQLRWLEEGVTIMTALTEHDNHAVDIPEDIQKLESIYKSDN